MVPFILTAESGLIIGGGTGPSGYMPGDTLPPSELDQGIELEIDQKTISWLVHVPLPQSRNNPQQNFLDTVQRGLIISSIVTLLIALSLGGILIRSLTHPIRKLAEATEAVADGELGYHMDIDSGDELGRLANSFNSMSTELAQTDHARKQITADIAHDLRTLLSVLLGYTEALSEGKLSGNHDTFQIMHQQAQHLNYLIGDLRTLSLLDAGELTFHMQHADPALFMQKTIAAFRPLLQEKGLNLRLDIEENLPRVEIDPERMSQVLGNLLNNAIRVLSPGGTIQVSAISEKDALIVQVADNGPGIPAEDLPHIFDRFYWVDKARQQDEGASGLGLAIAKKLVEAQGGEISVDSEPGQGTIFTIRFTTA